KDALGDLHAGDSRGAGRAGRSAPVPGARARVPGEENAGARLAIPAPGGGRRSLRGGGAVPGAVAARRLLLLGVLPAVLDGLLEVADPLADPLAELRELPDPEEEDDDEEKDQKFRESEVGHVG